MVRLCKNMFMLHDVSVCMGSVGLARGGKGGVPPQAPCLIKFIRIDIDLYIR